MSRIPITADVSTFFNTGEFAQVITHPGGTFNAIQTDYYNEMDGGSVGIEGAEIILICSSDDLLSYPVDHGTMLTIGGDVYSVVNIRPDNNGITRLQLTRL